MARAILEAEKFLDVPPSAANGARKTTEGWDFMAVQVDGNFAGGWSVSLQGTIDGTNWVDIVTGITAATVVHDDGTVTLMRVRWNALRMVTAVVGTGSPPTAAIGGFHNAR